jgi:hypothetical protein
MSTQPEQIPQAIESLTQQYHSLRQVYSTSSLGLSLRKLINNNTWDIDNAIAIGIGSLTAQRKGFFSKRVERNIQVNLWRLIAFHDVVDFVGVQKGHVFAVDEGFNELDVAILKSLGVEVIYERFGYLEASSGRPLDLSENSFLFATVTGRLLDTLLLKGELPALCIGPVPSISSDHDWQHLPCFESCSPAFERFIVQRRRSAGLVQDVDLRKAKGRGVRTSMVCKVCGLI